MLEREIQVNKWLFTEEDYRRRLFTEEIYIFYIIYIT